MPTPEFNHDAVAYNSPTTGPSFELGNNLGFQVTFEKFGVNFGVVSEGNYTGTITSNRGSWVSIYHEDIDKLITILEYYRDVYENKNNR